MDGCCHRCRYPEQGNGKYSEQRHGNVVEAAACSEGEQSRRDLGRLKLKGYVRVEGAVLFDSAALIVGGCSPPINDILRLCRRIGLMTMCCTGSAKYTIC
jgi:hypothetical protein